MHPGNPEPADNKRFKALVAPLDWGTGHAARCIPVINELISAGFSVIIGTSGKSGIYLKNRFPALETVTLPSREIRYSGSNIFRGLIRQLPGFLLFTLREHRYLKTLLARLPVDVIISDNRYGMYNRNVYNVIITHQLFIRIPHRFRVLSRIVWRITTGMLSKFNECWIPDMPDSMINLCSEMSHGNIRFKNYRYVGLLSRFYNYVNYTPEFRPEKYDLLVILSGPEPQRTLLENIVLQQIHALNIKSVIFRGLPEGKNTVRKEGCITLIDNPDDKTFAFYAGMAEKIISRAGYSTIMDLVALRRNALLIPTPGQTEQEYLARSLAEKDLFIFLSQNSFQLKVALKRMKKLSVPDFKNFITDLSLLKHSLCDLTDKMNKQ